MLPCLPLLWRRCGACPGLPLLPLLLSGLQICLSNRVQTERLLSDAGSRLSLIICATHPGTDICLQLLMTWGKDGQTGPSVPRLEEEKEGLSPWGQPVNGSCFWSDRQTLGLWEEPCRQTAGLSTDRETALGWLNLACGGNVIWKMEQHRG